MVEGKNKKPHKKWEILNRRTIGTLVVVLLGILFYVALNHASEIAAAVNVFVGVIRPFIVGFAIAYLLNTPMCFFERKLFSKYRFRRIFSLLTVYLIAFAVVVVLLNLIIPQVGKSVTDLVTNIDIYLKGLSDFVQSLTERFHLEGEGITNVVGSYQGLMKKLAGMVSEALPQVISYVVALGSGILSAVTALMSSIYMLAGKERLIRMVKKILYAIIPKRKTDRLLRICGRANRVFIGFINGKLLDSAIIGGLCFLFCTILRIPYSVLISIVVGVTNIIPFFGPIFGAIPCVMILLIVNPWAALRFLLLIIALQTFDGNILGPKILGDSTGLSAIWVLVSITVGGGLFGFPGMVLGVPTFAVIYALGREWVNRRLAARKLDGEGNPLPPAEEEPTEPEPPDGQTPPGDADM